MRTLSILHISDAHIQKRDKEEIKDIIEKLVADVIKVQKQEKIKIDLICFTGDLIQRGDKSFNDEYQWDLAQSILVEPLLENLELTKNEYIMVPGNHEVDISKIDSVIEKGLLVNSLEEINFNIENMRSTYLERLKYFYDYIKKDHTDVCMEKVGYTFIKNVNGISVGVACLDSSWRSSGKGDEDRGILYVGEKQVNDLYKHIKDTDIKICLMHHTTDWLSGYENSQIEKQLNKFNLVLCGHVHENDTKVILRKEMNTIYSVAGKLYPLDFAFGKRIDGYNGYSILNINLDTNLCTIFIRSYFAKDRGSFDSGINIIPEGKIDYPLNKDVEEMQVEYGIVRGLESFYLKMSDTLSLIKEIDSVAPEDIKEVYVDPILLDRSEYDKTDKEHKIEFSKLLNEQENIMIIGKKESGKTTILQKVGLNYVSAYGIKRIIPIYIDMRSLPKKGDVLLKSITHFISDYAKRDTKISREKVEKLISNGRCIFLIDNIDIDNPDHTNMINNFINCYSSNKFILAIQEDFLESLDVKKLPDYGTKFEKVYVGTFRKKQVRELVTKWASEKESVKNVKAVVEKINSYCDQLNMEKTPFNISIFMVIWDSNRSFIPQNEAYVMENYLEIVLDKLSFKEGDRRTYAFPIKQDFMSKVAYAMFEQNQGSFTKLEFNDFVNEYHERKGYKIEDTRFDTLFFEKNILGYSDECVFFRHTSIFEYYLAFYAKNNKEFLNNMIKKGNRFFFKHEICFYSGMVSDCKKLLDEIADEIMSMIIEDIECIDELNKIEIITDFKLNRNDIEKKILEIRPSQAQIDELYDYPVQETEPPQSDRMGNIEEFKEETEDFLSLLQMYGNILKNAELLDNTDKIYHLDNYMCAMNIVLVKLIKIAKDAKYDIIIDERDNNHLITENEVIKIKTQLYDVFQIAFPIAIQQVIFENVGTPKLELAIDNLLRKKQNKPFEKFMLNFLKSDLEIGNIISDLRKYIREESSHSILKIMQIKLMFYIMMRVWDEDKKRESELLDLLMEINFKLYPEQADSMKKEYKGTRANMQKKLIREIYKL